MPLHLPKSAIEFPVLDDDHGHGRAGSSRPPHDFFAEPPDEQIEVAAAHARLELLARHLDVRVADVELQTGHVEVVGVQLARQLRIIPPSRPGARRTCRHDPGTWTQTGEPNIPRRPADSRDISTKRRSRRSLRRVRSSGVRRGRAGGSDAASDFASEVVLAYLNWKRGSPSARRFSMYCCKARSVGAGHRDSTYSTANASMSAEGGERVEGRARLFHCRRQRWGGSSVFRCSELTDQN